MCQDLMKLARKADPECKFVSDIAFNLDPFILHKFGGGELPPPQGDEALDENGNTYYSNSYIPLVSAQPSIGLRAAFGSNMKALHLPKFSIATQTLTGLKYIPIHGSVNIFPGWENQCQSKSYEEGNNEYDEGAGILDFADPSDVRMEIYDEIRQPIIVNPNANIIQIKVYSDEHHERKKQHQGHMMDISLSAYKAKNRYEVLRKIVSELRKKKSTRLRIEITSVLPSLAYTSDEHTPTLDEAFTIQKNACCDLVPLLDFFFLPKEHACNTMDLVLDYAIAGTPHVPSYFSSVSKEK